MALSHDHARGRGAAAYSQAWAQHMPPPQQQQHQHLQGPVSQQQMHMQQLYQQEVQLAQQQHMLQHRMQPILVPSKALLQQSQEVQLRRPKPPVADNGGYPSQEPAQPSRRYGLYLQPTMRDASASAEAKTVNESKPPRPPPTSSTEAPKPPPRARPKSWTSSIT
jgi:hypothetical protein